MNHAPASKPAAQKHRFNIVDFVLITAVIACIIGIAIRYNLNHSTGRIQDKAIVTVKIDSLLNEYVDALVEGDHFYYQTTGNPVGTLLSIETEPAEMRVVSNDGIISTLKHDQRVNVFCTLEAEGYDSENGFMLNGSTYIGSGTHIPVRSNRLETEILILNVEPAE